MEGIRVPEPDGVPALLLKASSGEICKPLFFIWRASLDQGTIPPDLLLVIISPIHKRSSRGTTDQWPSQATWLRFFREFLGYILSSILITLTCYLIDSMGSGQVAPASLSCCLTGTWSCPRWRKGRELMLSLLISPRHLINVKQGFHFTDWRSVEWENKQGVG